MSAEYILAAGNQDVVLCERGIRTFEDAVRATLDLSSVPLALRESPVSRAGAAALAGAVDLYRGGFLADLHVHRAPAFEEWLLLQRERLRILALQALHGLVDYHAARSQPAQTLAHLDRLSKNRFLVVILPLPIRGADASPLRVIAIE